MLITLSQSSENIPCWAGYTLLKIISRQIASASLKSRRVYFLKLIRVKSVHSFNAGLTLITTFYSGLATPRHQSRQPLLSHYVKASRSRKLSDIFHFNIFQISQVCQQSRHSSQYLNKSSNHKVSMSLWKPMLGKFIEIIPCLAPQRE